MERWIGKNAHVHEDDRRLGEHGGEFVQDLGCPKSLHRWLVLDDEIHQNWMLAYFQGNEQITGIECSFDLSGAMTDRCLISG